jgi:hypothetical protein
VVRRFLALIIFLSFSHSVLAQNDCGETLNRAQDIFEAGHIEQIPNMLHECLDKFTTEQEIEAYRMLTIAYLYLNDPIGAETSFLALLKADPEYRVSANDPVELEHLSKQYITNPIISFTGKAGVNFSTVTILNYNRLDNDFSPNPNYKTGAGVVLQGASEVHFNKVIGLNLELELSSRSYTRESDLFYGNEEHQNLIQDRFAMHGSLPIYLKFTYPGVIYFPFVYAGYSPSLTLLSNSKETREPDIRGGGKVEGATLDNSNSTANFSQALVFGIGLKRRIKYKYVLVDLRYRLGMTNMNNQQNQYDINNSDTKEKIFKYSTLDDDLKWNGIELTVGYVWPQYKPRKKNSVTLQNIFKNWFGKKEKADE